MIEITRSEVTELLRNERHRAAAYYALLGPLVVMHEQGTTTSEQDELILRLLNDPGRVSQSIRSLENDLFDEGHPPLSTILTYWKHDPNPAGYVIVETRTEGAP